MSVNAPLPDKLRAVHEAAYECLDAAHKVLTWPSPARRTALAGQLATLRSALTPVDNELPDAGLSIARHYHGMVCDLCQQVGVAAEVLAQNGGKVLSRRWDSYFPLSILEFKTELDREILATAQDEVALTPEDVEIILCLAKAAPKCLLQVQIEGETALPRKTIYNRLRSLRPAGLIHRPHGERSGETLTAKGVAIAEKLSR
jgi:DNA-binding MarR family transcriptional regulator